MDNIKECFRQYQEAIEASNIVSKTDINGIITFVNDEFCKMSGFSREELIGANHNIVRHPEVPKEVFARLWETILAKKVHKGAIRNRTKDGRDVYLNTTVIPILNLHGQIEEFVAIRHDVTDVINLNNELKKTKKELLNLNENLENRVAEQTAELVNLNQNLENLVKAEIKKNEEKTKMLFLQSRLASMGEMIANIAHQWRQPLNELSITLFKLKESVKSNEKFETGYEHAKRVIKSMSQTIENFRNFFSVEREREIFSISSAVENALKMVQGTYEKEGIDVNLELKSDSQIYGFESQLCQAVIILLSNAKDALANKKDDKKVTLMLEKKDKFAIIRVTDNAGGIKEEIMDKIFEPYFTTKHPSAGTGIGLYMLKTIAKNHGGSASARNVKFGAEFEIKLPLKGGEDEKF